MSRARRLARLLAALPLALSCSGCLLLAYGLPDDKYETHLVFSAPAGIATGDLLMSFVGRDVIEVEGELSGLEARARYWLRYVTAQACSEPHGLFDALPAHAEPRKPNAIDEVMAPYIGPLPELGSDGAGKVRVDIRFAGNSFGGGAVGSRWVQVREGQSTWSGCARVNTIKVRDAWGGHPKM